MTLLVGASFPIGSKASVHDEEHFFETKVRPLLVAKCYECHSEEISEAGLRLDSYQSVLKGSDAGSVVTPGDIDASKIITVITSRGDMAMPPDGRLPAEEIKILEEWVKRGVPWSGAGSEKNPLSKGSESIAERIASAEKSHWSF